METTKKILVTGASGLLGTNTVLGLFEQRYHPRAFVRDQRKFLGGNHINLEFFEGDIRKKCRGLHTAF